MENIVDRFIRYVGYDTQSSESSSTVPSTEGQMVLLGQLEKEAKEIGLTDVKLFDTGYLMATVPATDGKQRPVVGFLAHVDTSPDVTGKNVKPQIIEKYDGKDIKLGDSLVMKVKEFPELELYRGDKLITTDGTTLLGADDKAGVAIIMDMAAYLMEHPEIPHGKIRIAFTPDEEIGRGMDNFDVEAFGADFAYTIDGSRIGELEYESFNAAEARIEITGRNVHPGYAKDKMINALEVARNIDDMIPVLERPQYTEGYEGFYHLLTLCGDVEKASMHYLIRDHDREMFEFRKNKVKAVVESINDDLGHEAVSLQLRDQYYNMKDAIEPVMNIVNLVEDKMQEMGIVPNVHPIRGGTDGSRLSFMGVPCPNIFTGGENFHGRYEFVSCTAMEKCSKLLVEIVKSLVKSI